MNHKICSLFYCAWCMMHHKNVHMLLKHDSFTNIYISITYTKNRKLYNKGINVSTFFIFVSNRPVRKNSNFHFLNFNVHIWNVDVVITVVFYINNFYNMENKCIISYQIIYWTIKKITHNFPFSKIELL